MKKFLLKSLLVFAIFFAVAGLPNLLFCLIAPAWVKFELPKDTTVVFIGDSHIEIGIDEKFIPGSINFAKSAEPFLDMYPRLKKLLEANPQISTVFVDVTPHNLRKDKDGNIHSEDMRYLLRQNLRFYSLDEMALIPPKTYLGAIFNYRVSGSSMKSLIFKNPQKIFENLGCHFESNKRGLEADIKYGHARKRLGFSNNSPYGNEVQLKYLRKIVEYVRARNVRIIFLNTPIYHPYEFFDIPYYEVTLKANFSDVEIWDYANFPIPDECRQDVNHLNKWGAEIFSKELARRMREEGIVGHETAAEM